MLCKQKHNSAKRYMKKKAKDVLKFVNESLHLRKSLEYLEFHEIPFVPMWFLLRPR